jgi:hypothetical protein
MLPITYHLVIVTQANWCPDGRARQSYTLIISILINNCPTLNEGSLLSEASILSATSQKRQPKPHFKPTNQHLFS